MNNDNVLYFRDLQEEAIAKSTKRLYGLKVKALMKFLMESYPETLQNCNDTGELEILLLLITSCRHGWAKSAEIRTERCSHIVW